MNSAMGYTEGSEEPMTDGFAPEYVKEEVRKLMAYKIQAYEQLIEIQQLKEALREITDCKGIQPASHFYQVPFDIMNKARNLLNELDLRS